MAKQKLGKINTIKQGDCIKLMRKLPDGCVDLAFADPPFNIGYKYDVYDDRKSADEYLGWSRDWMGEVHRILKRDGAFWLAIGDDFAAELKLLAQDLGFHARNWVIWYYTFGVHCKYKFTRSHTHLFYFVKDKKNFTFNGKAIAVPSARQMVYNDSRGNPDGRMPDDTWILRPQDCADGFGSEEDVWYFPRVAGTFKERKGFHGCQMPEQLLGRIIRGCSNPDELVFDPFSGSATTVAVAKKLGRRFLAYDLSEEYVKLGLKRLKSIKAGDRLDGAEEPRISAPSTPKARKGKRGRVKKHDKKRKETVAAAAPPPADKTAKPPKNTTKNTTKKTTKSRSAAKSRDVEKGVLQAFSQAGRGYSVDRLIADREMNEEFLSLCRKSSLPGTDYELNRHLFRLRKTGRLSKAGVRTEQRTAFDWRDFDDVIDASEIAWRRMYDDVELGLDDLFCHPEMADRFDQLAAEIAPGYESLRYRWAAFKLRKEAKRARNRGLKIESISAPKRRKIDELNLNKLDNRPGVYVVYEGKRAIYAGEALDLRERLQKRFVNTDASAWCRSEKPLRISVIQDGLIQKADERHIIGDLLALQSRVITDTGPELNALHLAAM